jgi:hypothetical protein
MTSDDRDRGFVRNVGRFVWWPRGARRVAAPIRPLARVWLFCVGTGAGAAAIGWSEGPVLMVLGMVFALLDDVIEGVRYRWPAFVVGQLAGWHAARLVKVGTSAPADPDWADYPAVAFGTLVAIAVFAAVTRLPEHRWTAPRW